MISKLSFFLSSSFRPLFNCCCDLNEAPWRHLTEEMSGRIWLLVLAYTQTNNLSQFFSERTWTEKSWCFWCSLSWAHRPMFIGNICASRPAQVVVMLCSHGISPSSWKQGVSKFLVLVPELQKKCKSNRILIPRKAETLQTTTRWMSVLTLTSEYVFFSIPLWKPVIFPWFPMYSRFFLSHHIPSIPIFDASILFHPPAARPQLACACHWACCAAAVGSASHCPLGHVSLPGGNLVPIPQNLVIS